MFDKSIKNIIILIDYFSKLYRNKSSISSVRLYHPESQLKNEQVSFSWLFGSINIDNEDADN